MVSPNLQQFLSENKEKLSCDVVLISDSDMWDRGIPAITCSLRGLCALEVSLKTANSDLHSGMFGGGVQMRTTYWYSCFLVFMMQMGK